METAFGYYREDLACALELDQQILVMLETKTC